MQRPDPHYISNLGRTVRPRPMSNETRKMLVESGVKEYPPKHAARVAAAEAKRQRKAAKRVADAKKAFLDKIVISYDTFHPASFPATLNSETMHIRGSLAGLPMMEGASLIDIGGISPHVPPKLHIIGTGENGERLEAVFDLVEEFPTLHHDTTDEYYTVTPGKESI
jgi:hypothetical protein